MNSNYEFNKQMARDRQRAFHEEGRQHRLAKRAGSGTAYLLVVKKVSSAGARLNSAVHRANKRASGYGASLKTRLHWPGPAAL